MKNNHRIDIRGFSNTSISTFVVYVLLFLSVHLTGINPLVLQSDDIIATSTLPFSILKEGNLDLDEYYGLLTKYYPQPDDPSNTPHYLRKSNGHYYNNYPMFTSFAAVPVYILPALMGADRSIEGIRIMSRLGGAFLTSLSVGLFYLILKERVKDKKNIWILLLIYALGTNSLSISSQGLWQHGTSQLMLSIGLLALLRKNYGMAGLFNGFAYWARPTNLLPVAVIGMFLLWENRKDISRIIRYSFFAFMPILSDILLSAVIFGGIGNTEYGSRLSEFNGNWIIGFLGMWFSPSKGILVCSPVFIFMFYGLANSLKKISRSKLEMALIVIIVFHTIIIGRWYSWFGGYAWGYRMASDILPYMVFMLIPFVESKYMKQLAFKVAFFAAAAFSVFVQFLGLAYFDSVWHTIFDGKGNWLWDIPNSQILFSVKRMLHKFGLIENPVPVRYLPEGS